MRLLMSEEQVGRTTFVQGDVTDLPSLKAAVAANQITQIVHLAGLMVPACRADPILGAKVNVLGTLAVFEAAPRSQRTSTTDRLRQFGRCVWAAGELSRRSPRR